MKNKRLLACLMGLGLGSSVVALDNDAMRKESAPQDAGVASVEPQDSLELSAEDAKKLEELFNNPEFLKELEEEVKKYEELERQAATATAQTLSDAVVAQQEAQPAEEVSALFVEDVAPVAPAQQSWWDWFKGLFGF